MKFISKKPPNLCTTIRANFHLMSPYVWLNDTQKMLGRVIPCGSSFIRAPLKKLWVLQTSIMVLDVCYFGKTVVFLRGKSAEEILKLI